MLEGAKLTGGNPKNNRVELDYYATDPNAVRRFLRCHQLRGDSFLEPSVGGGEYHTGTAREISNSGCYWN